MANYKDIKYDYPASAITSGTFANARLSESSVTQHVTAFDDNKIVNDLSTLALRQASDNNKAAYNTNSSFVDVFQDSSGITNLTNASRNTSEYIDTSVAGASSTYQTTALSSSYVAFVGSIGDGTASHLIDGTLNTWAMYITAPSGFNTGFQYNIVSDTNFSSNFYVDSVSLYNHNTIARVKDFKIQFYYNSTWNDAEITAADNASSVAGSSTILRASNADNWSTGNITTPINNANFRMVFDGYYDNGNSNAGIAEMKFSGYNMTTNATGSFENNAITASSSVSSMGAIITYQDNAGTNALNTDIVLQLSADGGSNWSTATLSALPDFSTGIKMAKVNDLAVTAGTQLKYKISFANQSSGSKEARIRGVSLQY